MILGITSTMISSMKGVKMAGLTQRLTEIIQDIRIAEVVSGYKFRMMMVYNLIFGMLLSRKSVKNSQTDYCSLHASSSEPSYYLCYLHTSQSFG